MTTATILKQEGINTGPTEVVVHNKVFVSYIDHNAIQSKVAELAKQIEQDHLGKMPVFLPVLNGSFFFFADLLKNISEPCELSFIKISSYKGMDSSGRIRATIGLDIELLRNRNIIIVEDIIDTGRTMKYLLNELAQVNPAGIKIASLIIKPDALVEKDIVPDYVGFQVDNKFLVGYGLDYDGHGRHYNDIYQLKTD
ncbi:MAG: hypoxanthine phosphoribosyltransferase [Bacteroidota bacterium]|nr:hypoxanthine phosphoribosyltransferase [Bacteroidota bacterium]